MPIGNECDLCQKVAIKTEEAKTLDERESLYFMETSGLDTTNVEIIFTKVFTQIHKIVSKRSVDGSKKKEERQRSRTEKLSKGLETKTKKDKEKIQNQNPETDMKKSTKDPEEKKKKRKGSKSDEVIFEISLIRHESLQKKLKQANIESESQAKEIEELKQRLGEKDEELDAMHSSSLLGEQEIDQMSVEISTTINKKVSVVEVHLSPKIYEISDWVKFKRGITTPLHRWLGSKPKSVGFVQTIRKREDMIVIICAARVLANEVVKLIQLDRGQHVKLGKDVGEPRFGWCGQSRDSIGTFLYVDEDGILRVMFPGASQDLKTNLAEMEHVEELKIDDWVRSKPSLRSKLSYDVRRDNIVIVHSIQETCYLELACCFHKGRWSTHYTDLEKIPILRVSQFVHFPKGLTEPRWGWRGDRPNSQGIITIVHAEEGSTFIDCDHGIGHKRWGDTLARALGRIKLREMRDLVDGQNLVRKGFKFKGENVGLSLKRIGNLRNKLTPIENRKLSICVSPNEFRKLRDIYKEMHMMLHNL